MFYIKIGDISGTDDFLYYPGDEEFTAFETVLNQKIGECGDFSIKIPHENPISSKIKEHQIITIYRNDEEYWRGYIKEISVDFSKIIEVYCIEDLGWLNYEFMPPSSEHVLKSQKLQQIINYYNSQDGIQGTEKEFEVGYVSTDIIKNFESSYEDSLLDNLRNVAGADNYVRVRRINGHRYIDIVTISNFGKKSEQAVMMGDNLLNYTKELNTGYMLNVIYPYGEELEEDEIYDGLPRRIKGNTYSDTESIKKHGRIAKNIFFETTDIDTLNRQAQEYLNRNKEPRLSMELTAVDLSQFDILYDSLDIGDSVRVIAEPFNIDQWIYITELTTNLQDPTNNQFVLSSTIIKTSLTSQQTAINAEIQKIPSKTALIESSRNNIMQLLKGVDGGYVTYKFNEYGQQEQLRVANHIDFEQATEAWILNLGGFTHIHRESASEEWEASGIDVALTMDGQILARRGQIGSDELAWIIGEHSIFNGTKSPTDYDTPGLYIGTDGIMTVAEGALGYKVHTKISGGQIESTSLIKASRMIAGTLSSESIIAENGKTISLGFTAYVNGVQRVVGLSFTDGILTGVS